YSNIFQQIDFPQISIRMRISFHTMQDSCPAIYFSLFTTFRIATERFGLRESLVIRRIDVRPR
ncbi:MAG: hypothetical protein WBZ36_21040, partial [Candidatus Nitrosopolaris sp.]